MGDSNPTPASDIPRKDEPASEISPKVEPASEVQRKNEPASKVSKEVEPAVTRKDEPALEVSRKADPAATGRNEKTSLPLWANFPLWIAGVAMCAFMLGSVYVSFRKSLLGDPID